MKKLAALVVGVMALSVGSAANAATNPVVFNSVPDQLPYNVASVGPEAYAFAQIGDGIQLAPGKRVLKSVKVVLSSWACETGDWTSGCVTTPGSTFAQAITFNIYNLNLDGSVGSLVTSKTQTFQIKYRPSSDLANCDATAWQAADGQCYHGLAQKISFAFGSQNQTLPSRLVYGIAFNTRDFGPSPTGIAGPADSLNVGTEAGLPKRGTDLSSGGYYVNGTSGGTVIDSPCTASTPATPGVFSLDDGCGTGYNPLVRFLVKL